MMSLKKYFVVPLALIVMVFGSTGIASAHTLAQDGKISAFLHVEPNDMPQPGKINKIAFYINDQDFKFSLSHCDCVLKVYKGSQSLYKGPLQPLGTRNGEAAVMLPSNNFSYDVVFTGKPVSGSNFQPFKLNFDIDVGQPVTDSSLLARNTRGLIALGLLGVVFGGYTKSNFRNNKLKNKIRT